jgi:hypothetical protein
MSETHNGEFYREIVTKLNLNLSDKNVAKVVTAISDTAIAMRTKSISDLVIIRSLLLLF